MDLHYWRNFVILWAFQTDVFIVQGDLFYSLSITWQYKGSKGVTGGYRGAKGVTDHYRGLQGVTGGYKGLQGVTRG